jgi:hypothetical protein
VLRRCEGPDCDVDFDAKTIRARFHSSTCRTRAARARRAAEVAAETVLEPETEPSDPDTGSAEHGLVKAVRKELTDAEALDTVAGQLALQVARRIAAPDGSGISALSKELRSLVAEAKGGGAQPGPEPEPTPAEPDEDEVAKARRLRAEQRAAAGLG